VQYSDGVMFHLHTETDGHGQDTVSGSSEWIYGRSRDSVKLKPTRKLVLAVVVRPRALSFFLYVASNCWVGATSGEVAVLHSTDGHEDVLGGLFRVWFDDTSTSKLRPAVKPNVAKVRMKQRITCLQASLIRM